MITDEDRERFQRRINKKLSSNCWIFGRLYVRAGAQRGYRGFRFEDGTQADAHVAAWKMFKGDIPAGFMVLHSCDNRKCVNYEEHLFLGTQTDNMRGAAIKGRGNCKLSLRDITAIQLDRTTRRQVLALRYGVTIATISNVRHGKRWKYRQTEEATDDLIQQHATQAENTANQNAKEITNV